MKYISQYLIYSCNEKFPYTRHGHDGNFGLLKVKLLYTINLYYYFFFRISLEIVKAKYILEPTNKQKIIEYSP